MTAPSISGVYSAAATPLSDSGAPDHGLFSGHCKALLNEGCDGIALLGTTGEANSFGMHERTEILENLISSGVSPDRLMPGTAQSAVPDTVLLTKHAVESGVRAVLLLPPFYYKDLSDEGVFRSIAAVIDGVGDDRLRIILYHIPQVSGVAISHAVIERLRKAYPGIVAGIKDSAGDLSNMEAMIKKFPGFSVLAGADPLLLPLMKLGGAGCITATSNMVASDLRIVFDKWNQPDAANEVEAAQERINSWRNLTNGHYVQLPTIKAMLARYRDDIKWLKVRPPLVELDAAERTDIWERMKKMGG